MSASINICAYACVCDIYLFLWLCTSLAAMPTASKCLPAYLYVNIIKRQEKCNNKIIRAHSLVFLQVVVIVAIEQNVLVVLIYGLLHASGTEAAQTEPTAQWVEIRLQ